VNKPSSAYRLYSFWPVLLALAAFIPSFLIHTRGVVLPEDDAFIIYRYVKNAVAGSGLVYNPGEHVFGSTTPLYTLWLVLLKSVFHSIEIDVLAVRGNFIFFALSALGIQTFLFRLTASRFWSVAGMLYCALQPDLIGVSVSGMESSLFICLCLWSFAVAVRGSMYLACFLAGAATLTRPEGVFCLLSLVCLLEWKSLKSLIYSGLAFSVPVLTWVVPAWLYYGSPIPHSILAKSAPLYELPPLYSFKSIMRQMDFWLTRVFPESWFDKGMPYAVWVTVQSVVVTVFSVSLVLCFRKARVDKRYSIPILFAGSLIAFYTISNPLMMGWYWGCVHTAWFFLVLVSASVLQERMPSGKFWSFLSCTFRKDYGVAVVFAFWVLLVTSWYWVDTIRLSQPPFNGDRFSLGRDRNPTLVRIDGYRRAGLWLNEHASDLPRIAAPEIGALGYYYEGPVLDTCALVSPEALPFHPIPPEDRIAPNIGTIPSALIRELQPEMIVTLRTFARKSLMEGEASTLKAEFSEDYTELQRIPLLTPVWGSTDILVFGKASSRSVLGLAE
jgi:hypothetical protein